MATFKSLFDSGSVTILDGGFVRTILAFKSCSDTIVAHAGHHSRKYLPSGHIFPSLVRKTD